MSGLGDPAVLSARVQAAAAAHLSVALHVAVDRTGPAALTRALRAAGRSTDAPIWPCPYASLTHSGAVAIAVALPATSTADGLGVDLELDRPVRPGLARLVCDAHELAWLDTLPAEQRAAETLRLWTIKEALYKADPVQGDAIVADYAVANPGDERTTGRRSGSADQATVFSMRFGGGVLSVALRPRGGS